MEYNGSLFFLAQSNLSDAFDVLSTLKTNISACTSNYPRGYEYKSDIEEAKTIIINVNSTVSGLTRTVSDLKEKLMNLDNVFALNYYNDVSQKYQDLVGPLTEEQQIYKEYTQKQFNEQLYKYLDDIKDNLTPEQKEIYDALKEQKVIEKKYNELQKLYEKKDDNNAFWHPVKEENLRQEILALENELREKHNVNINGYSNTWYEDFKDAGTKTGAAWVDAGKSLLKGEGLGKTLDAVKQTATTGAVVYKSAKSGVNKIGELVGDGLLAAGGSIVAGATWLFHDTWSDNDVAGTVMDWTLDQVRRDRVGEANKEFYEKNPIGKWINENSNLKYDSAGAKAIQKTSKLATEIVIATAAEIGSFGAATPLVTAMFVAEGAGEAAESYAQSFDRNNGESYNYGMALGSTALGAFSGAMKGKMYGKIGGNTLNILKNPSLIKTGVSLLKETGAKKILTNELKSTSFWFDFLTTGGQKAGEVVNEYHQTGNINWGKAFTTFAGELLYARFTDKLTANNVDDLINQKSVFQTVKDISSNVKNISRKAGNAGNNIFSEVDLDDPVTFNNYMDSLTSEQRTAFMTNYYSSMYGEAFEGKFSGPISYVDPKAREFNKNLLLTKAHEISGWIDITEPRALIWTIDSSNGKLKVDVDWPKYGGMKLKSIMGLDSIEGDIIRLDRFGSQGGGTYALVPSNGKPYSLRERAIFNNLNSSNPNVSGYRQIEFNKTKYMDFCDGADSIISYCNVNSIDFSMASFNVEVQKKIQDLTTKLGLELNSENISKVDAAIFGERGSYISDLALKDGSYYNGTGVKSGAWRDDIVGVEEATGISRKYGYVGEAAPWITPDGVIIAGGGAFQLNLRTSEATLNSLGIMKSSDNLVFNN